MENNRKFGTDSRLISKYNPQLEAQRFVEHMIADHRINENSIVIVIGPVSVFLKSSLNRAGIGDSSMFLCFFRDDHAAGERIENTWIYDSGISLSTFLHTKISGDCIHRLAIIEWKPTVKAFPQISSYIHREIKTFTARLYANIHSFGKLGHSWMRNYIINYLSINEYIQLINISGDCILAVPGTSLNDLLPIIKRHRKGAYIACLSSALRPLLANDILPDAVIQSDGGFYSSRYTDYFTSESTVLIKTGASAINRLSSTVFLRNGNPLEAFLPEPFTSKTFCIPDQGTVTYTAITFLSKIVRGSIFLCGLDLEHPIDTTHAKHHLQNILWSYGQTRLSTCFSNSVSSVLDRSKKHNHGTYIDNNYEHYRDFLSGSAPKSSHVFRVCPSSVSIGYDQIDIDNFEKRLASSGKINIVSEINENMRAQKFSFIDKIHNFNQNIGSFHGTEIYKEFFLYLSTSEYLKGDWNNTNNLKSSLKSLIGLADELLPD